MTRSGFLVAMELTDLCAGTNYRCDVYHGGELWDELDTTENFLRNGDYLLVQAFKEENIEQCQRVDAPMTEEIRDADRVEDGIDEETEDTLEEELGDDVLQLLQLRTRVLWRPSNTTSARLRLPPPGNGRKTVQFSCVIENDQGERSWDLAIGNRFAHGFCEPDDECVDNRFMSALIGDLPRTFATFP